MKNKKKKKKREKQWQWSEANTALKIKVQSFFLCFLSLSHSLTSQQRGTLNFLSFLLGLSPKNKKVFLSSFLSNPFSREEKKRRRESTHTQNTQGERERVRSKEIRMFFYWSKWINIYIYIYIYIQQFEIIKKTGSLFMQPFCSLFF